MQNSAHLVFLFRQLVGRELASRYRATVFGALWLVLQPLLMLAVYTLVFGEIFQIKWGGADNTAEFSIILFAGLLVFNLFSEVFVSSPGVIAAQPNYVKKVVFPIELLGAVRVAAALSSAVVALVILTAARIVNSGAPSAWFLMSPVIIVEMIPLLLGTAWLISAFGVYFRDLGHIAGVVTSIILFVSPIFFPADAMPATLKAMIVLNPLVTPITEFRNVAVLDSAPDFARLAVHFVLSVLFMVFSLYMFRRLARGFADVL